MERLNSGLEGVQSCPDESGESSFCQSDEPAENSQSRPDKFTIPKDLYLLNELDVLYDENLAALWSYMRPQGRPSFTSTMLRDFVEWQHLIVNNFGPNLVPLKFLVLGSRSPGVFCFGGDLSLFQSLIRDGDRRGLVEYGYRCVEILERNFRALDLPMLTIGLVEGSALGGGFEALLSFDVLIAERGVTFGLPEVMFGLFPGMGAHAFLSRKLGTAMAERMILSNQSYSAEQLYDMGLVHVLAEPGEAQAACQDYMQKNLRRHTGLVKARQAMREVSSVPLDELRRVVDHWADAALGLTEQDLKTMNRLTKAQSRFADAA